MISNTARKPAPKLTPRDRSNDAKLFDGNTFGHWLQRQAALESIGKVFIVGCYKSGTTWLQKMLDHHPEMVVKGEGSSAWKLVPMLKHALVEYHKHQHVNNREQFTCIQDIDCLALYRAAINTQLGNYLDASNSPADRIRIVGDKTPQHTVCMSTLSSIFPESKFIHIIRDPRDAAISSWFHGAPNRFGLRFGATITDHTAAFLSNNWPVNVRAASQAGDAMGQDRYCEVRYEDLLTDSPTEIRRIFSFCDVDDSEDTAAACAEACSFEALSKGRKNGEEKRDSFFRKGVAGDWKNHLDPETIVRLCTPIHDLMDRYGYSI